MLSLLRVLCAKKTYYFPEVIWESIKEYIIFVGRPIHEVLNMIHHDQPLTHAEMVRYKRSIEYHLNAVYNYSFIVEEEETEKIQRGQSKIIYTRRGINYYKTYGYIMLKNHRYQPQGYMSNLLG